MAIIILDEFHGQLLMGTLNNTSTDLQRTVCMLVNGELNGHNLSV